MCLENYIPWVTRSRPWLKHLSAHACCELEVNPRVWRHRLHAGSGDAHLHTGSRLILNCRTLRQQIWLLYADRCFHKHTIERCYIFNTRLEQSLTLCSISTGSWDKISSFQWNDETDDRNSHITVVVPGLTSRLRLNYTQCFSSSLTEHVKILQARLQQYVNCETPPAWTSSGSSKKQEFQKNIYSCFIDYAKAFDCVDHNKLENSESDGNTTPPDLPPEKPVCRSGSNS